MAAKIFRINYKSDFILTLHSDAGWMTPFCIKFWTGAPSQAFFAGWDGETYTHCSYDHSEPTKLVVQFDDHHLPIGDLKFQIAYHFTVDDFPDDTEDEVLNQANITTEIDGQTYQVMLDLNGETAPEIEFSLPAYANEAQRIANEEDRIAAEQQRIANEESRIAAEETRQRNEQQRIEQETARVNEFATLKSQSQAATRNANDAATLANQKAQLAADKAALADDAATLAIQKAQLAADKAALANDAAQLANEKAALAQQKAEYAQQQGGYAKDQGDYAKDQGDYAKAQGDIAQSDHERAETDHGIAADDHTQAGNDHTRAEADHGIAANDHTQAGNDHTRAESDHGIAANDHTQAGNDHTRAEADHGIAANDHTQAGNDHTRAESDHTRAESDHAAVEVYVDSLGAFDISAYHATGGVLAKYADLTAALGTNGANIPEALRKGGMSVKFVQGTAQSSDNKYVRFWLPKKQWSVDVADWQGIDEPLQCTFKDWRFQQPAKLIYIPRGLDMLVSFVNTKDSQAEFRAYLRKADGTNVAATNSGFVQVPAGGTFIGYLNTNGCEENTYLYITCGTDNTSKTDVSIEFVDHHSFWVNSGKEQIYFDVQSLRFDFDSTNIYIHFTYLRTRLFKALDISLGQVATMVGQTPTTSPNGLADCIVLGDANDLVINTNDFAVSIKNRGTEVDGDIVLLANVGGYIVNIHPSIVGKTVRYSEFNLRNFKNISEYQLAYKLTSADMKQGNIANNDTYVSTSTSCIYKDYTPIDPNHFKSIKFLGSGVGIYKLRLNFYNSSKSAIYGSGTYAFFTEIPVPSNAAYFRLGIYDGDTNVITPEWIDTVDFRVYFNTVDDIIGIFNDKEVVPLKKRIEDDFGSIYETTIKQWRYQEPKREILVLKGIPLTVSFKNVLSNTSQFEARLQTSDGTNLEQSGWIDVAANGTFTYTFNNNYGATHLYITCATNNTSKTDVTLAYKNGIAKTSAISPEFYDYQDLIDQVNKKKRDGSTILSNPLVLLHFSDIHGDKDALRHLIVFKNTYSDKVNDILNTGDLQSDYWNSGISFFNIDGCENILNVIGNHDAWAGSSYGPDLQAKTDVYGRFIAPYVSNWDVVQPVNAAENGLNYYYKDYTTQGVRLIVLDCMYWDSTQNTWLQNVLADAKANSLSVICSSHYTPGAITPIDCSFDNSIWRVLGDSMLNSEAAASVNSFINGGGKFITWLVGHAHNDYLGTLISYPEQLVVCVDTANCSNPDQSRGSAIERIKSTKSQYLFNIFGVDTYLKVIKLYRVGATNDALMRSKKQLSINYETKVVVWNS